MNGNVFSFFKIITLFVLSGCSDLPLDNDKLIKEIVYYEINVPYNYEIEQDDRPLRVSLEKHVMNNFHNILDDKTLNKDFIGYFDIDSSINVLDRNICNYTFQYKKSLIDSFKNLSLNYNFIQFQNECINNYYVNASKILYKELTFSYDKSDCSKLFFISKVLYNYNYSDAILVLEDGEVNQIRLYFFEKINSIWHINFVYIFR